MSRATLRRRSTTALGALALLAGASLAAAATPHARDLNAEFLASAPAPAQPVAVCVIDSGVSLTPEVQGAVVARLNALVRPELDDAVTASGHGTLVAGTIAGRRGIWPPARIVSVRAWTGDGGDAYSGIYERAIYACLESGQPVRVINLSVADTPAGPEAAALLASAVRDATGGGVSVVVAAGNGAGAPLETPADLPGVIAVAAADPQGALCGYSSRAPGILTAPGCPVSWTNLDGSVGTGDGGTSLAAPQVAALLAALRAYRPELSRAQAEALLSQSARPGAEGSRRVDAAAAFRAAGLGGLVTSPPAPLASRPAPARTPARARPARRARPRTPDPRLTVAFGLRYACARAERLGPRARLVWSGHPARRLGRGALRIPLGPRPSVIWTSAVAPGRRAARPLPTRLPARMTSASRLASLLLPARPC